MNRIVMIGGGYTSHGAWKVLRRRLRAELADGRAEATVVSARNYHYFHGFVGEMISGVMSVAGGMSAARHIFAGARFVEGRVTCVDTGRRQVFVSSGDTGGELVLSYDHLVVGVGASYRRDAVPGLGDFGWAMRDIGALQAFRNHVIGCFERADAARDQDQARRALTFVVAGGGFAGVEITAALSELAIEMRRYYRVLDRLQPRLVLVHPGPRILPEMAAVPRVVRYAERQLARYGVELWPGARVTRVGPSAVTLSNGAEIETDTVLSTIGNQVTPLPGLDVLPLDSRRRLITNAFLQVGGADGVWSGGDCARVLLARNSTPCPTNALWAVKHGEHIGRNVARVIRGQRPRPFTFRGLGTAASMGIGKGMGELFGVPVTGWLAWIVRLMVFLYFMPSRRQALNALLEHAKLPLCGRSVVPLDVSGPKGIGESIRAMARAIAPQPRPAAHPSAGRPHCFASEWPAARHATAGRAAIRRTRPAAGGP